MKRDGLKSPFSTILSARRTLCIHPEVNVHNDRDKIDAECKKRTKLTIHEKCHFFSNYEEKLQDGKADPQ